VQVIELGQLGLGRSQERPAGSGQQEAAGRAGEGPARFYVHTQRGASFGDASALANALQAAGNATQQVSLLQSRHRVMACNTHGQGRACVLRWPVEVVLAHRQQPAWRSLNWPCPSVGQHTCALALFRKLPTAQAARKQASKPAGFCPLLP
jgi:hypothetical protein